MMRLSRVFTSVTLACCLGAPASWFAACGDDTTAPPSEASITTQPTETTEAPAASAAEPEAKPTLDDLTDTFWHYGKIARYDLAADAGKKILDCGADASAILTSFEMVAARHNDMIDTWMLRWKSLPVSEAGDRAAVQAMRQVTAKLDDVIAQGYAARRSDPNFIRQTIYEMSVGERAYDNNLPRLVQCGELPVKILIDILRDSTQNQYHVTCRRILRDLGRRALNPLLAATQMRDFDTLSDVISALGDIGSQATQIQNHTTFVNQLSDVLNQGIGNLVDADMAKESATLQALQVQQQLGVQALSIANAAPQMVLSLFK